MAKSLSSKLLVLFAKTFTNFLYTSAQCKQDDACSRFNGSAVEQILRLHDHGIFKTHIKTSGGW